MSKYGSRVDQAEVTLNVGGVDTGIWDDKTGGDKDSDENKIRRGGMGGQVALGGPSNITNVTLSRTFDPDRDGPLLPYLLASVDVDEDCTVGVQGLDRHKAPKGKPQVYGGVIKSVAPPPVNKQGSDEATITVEISTDSYIAAV